MTDPDFTVVDSGKFKALTKSNIAVLKVTELLYRICAIYPASTAAHKLAREAIESLTDET